MLDLQKNDRLSASLTWKCFTEADSKLWILYSPALSVDKSFSYVCSVKDETSVQTHTDSPGDCVHTGLGSSWLSHRLSFRFRLSAGCLRSLPVHANVQLQGTSWKTESRDRRGDVTSGWCCTFILQPSVVKAFQLWTQKLIYFFRLSNTFISQVTQLILAPLFSFIQGSCFLFGSIKYDI